MANPNSQPTSKTPATPNPFSPVSAVDLTTRALHHRVESTRSAVSTVLKDTRWPRESADIAQNLVHIISKIPDLPAEGLPAKDGAEQSILILEAVHTRVRNASEKYGERERGFRDGMKYNISSLRPIA